MLLGPVRAVILGFIMCNNKSFSTTFIDNKIMYYCYLIILVQSQPIYSSYYRKDVQMVYKKQLRYKKKCKCHYQNSVTKNLDKYKLYVITIKFNYINKMSNNSILLYNVCCQSPVHSNQQRSFHITKVCPYILPSVN